MVDFDGNDRVRVDASLELGQSALGEDGNTYVGNFLELFCNSYNWSTYSSSVRDHKGMWDEDPTQQPPQDGLEDVVLDSDDAVRKVILNGQLYIIRGKAIYNIQGQQVR